MSTVLIVEDDLLISDLLDEAVSAGGFEVCGIATTVDEAIAMGERFRPDLGIIDVRLANGGDGTVVAARLLASAPVGILYATGNVDYVLTTGAAGHACLKKPYRPSEVVAALRVIEHILKTGTAPESLPRNLLILARARESLGGP
jgi:DNA-binding response OmpR family regulator